MNFKHHNFDADMLCYQIVGQNKNNEMWEQAYLQDHGLPKEEKEKPIPLYGDFSINIVSWMCINATCNVPLLKLSMKFCK